MCQLVYFCIFLKAYCCFVLIIKYILLSALHLNISIYVVLRLNAGIVLCFATGPGFNSQRRQLFSFLFFSLFSKDASLYIIASFEVYLIAESKKITCTGRLRGSNIFQGWGSNSIAFKVSPGHLLPPPPLRVRA